ncbi:MAG: hypothetical protein ABH828_00930 [archaeon]
MKCLEGIYNHEGQGFCLYAEENKEVVGLIFAQPEMWANGDHLYVYFTAVD